MRKVISVSELSKRLGSYIEEVRNGTTFVVTERGEPMAELRPLPYKGTQEEVQLHVLVATGKISRSSSVGLQPFKPIRIKGKPLSQTILEDRQEQLCHVGTRGL